MYNSLQIDEREQSGIRLSMRKGPEEKIQRELTYGARDSTLTGRTRAANPEKSKS